MNINCYFTSTPTGSLHECRRGVTYKTKKMLKWTTKKFFFICYPQKCCILVQFFFESPALLFVVDPVHYSFPKSTQMSNQYESMYTKSVHTCDEHMFSHR